MLAGENKWHNKITIHYIMGGTSSHLAPATYDWFLIVNQNFPPSEIPLYLVIKWISGWKADLWSKSRICLQEGSLVKRTIGLLLAFWLTSFLLGKVIIGLLWIIATYFLTTRDTVKGQKYTIWKLSDLSSQSAVISILHSISNSLENLSWNHCCYT